MNSVSWCGYSFHRNLVHDEANEFGTTIDKRAAQFRSHHPVGTPIRTVYHGAKISEESDFWSHPTVFLATVLQPPAHIIDTTPRPHNIYQRQTTVSQQSSWTIKISLITTRSSASLVMRRQKIWRKVIRRCPWSDIPTRTKAQIPRLKHSKWQVPITAFHSTIHKLTAT